MSINKNFLPGISHPYYFMRTGLYEGIKAMSGNMTGILLDFGCGEKPYRSLFSVEKYIGLDYENPGHNHENENIDVFYDGKNIPFDSEYFDSVLCSEVFEHLFDIEYTLKEINRVLKKGGKLLITCPFVWVEHEVPHDFARYTTFALKNLLTKHGFSVLSYEKKGNFIQTRTQISMLYFHYSFSPFFSRFSASRFFFRILVAIINSSGIIKSFLLPKRYDFYLSNIFLVEKV